MSQDESSSRSRRLNTILAEYLQAVEAGQQPDAQKLIAAHPEFADELREFLADKQNIDQIAKPSPELPTMTPTSESPTLPPASPSSEAATIPPSSNDGNVTEPTTVIGEKIRYFGDYELLEEIARGGMGVVYKAR